MEKKLRELRDYIDKQLQRDLSTDTARSHLEYIRSLVATTAPVAHIVGEGGKCWCGEHHANYHRLDCKYQETGTCHCAALLADAGGEPLSEWEHRCEACGQVWVGVHKCPNFAAAPSEGEKRVSGPTNLSWAIARVHLGHRQDGCLCNECKAEAERIEGNFDRLTAASPVSPLSERTLGVAEVEKIHEIIEKYSTDVVDYELATDDINAALGSVEGQGACNGALEVTESEFEALAAAAPPAPEGASLTEQKMAIAPLIVGDDDPAVAEKWWNKGRAGGLRDGVKAGLDAAKNEVNECRTLDFSLKEAEDQISALDPEAIAAKVENDQ